MRNAHQDRSGKVYLIDLFLKKFNLERHTFVFYFDKNHFFLYNDYVLIEQYSKLTQLRSYSGKTLTAVYPQLSQNKVWSTPVFSLAFAH